MTQTLPRPPAGDSGIHPLVEALAMRIRQTREALPGLAPLPLDPELEAISGSLDGEDLFIRNEVHRCHGLRKIHLETARLGAGLQILHCVFFPDPRFDLPIFGADIVAGRGGVSAAIADLSPVRGELPAPIDGALSRRGAETDFRERRELPSWGSIFSRHVLFVRPASEEEQAFVDEVGRFLGVMQEAVGSVEPEGCGDPGTIRRWDGQRHYCRQQKMNDKTRRVLAKAFDERWADRYIEEVLFDEPPAIGS